jgi:hypothetical protein
MGGMVAQELAVLLIPQRRLLSLALAITCRGMQPAWGLLAPVLSPRVILRFLQAWFGLAASRSALVRRLMRLLLTRELLASRHPVTGETYEEVRAATRLLRQGCCCCCVLPTKPRGTPAHAGLLLRRERVCVLCRVL